MSIASISFPQILLTVPVEYGYWLPGEFDALSLLQIPLLWCHLQARKERCPLAYFDEGSMICLPYSRGRFYCV